MKDFVQTEAFQPWLSCCSDNNISKERLLL